MVYVFVRAAGGGMAAYAAAVFNPSTAELLLRSVLLVVGVVGLSIVIALPLAWLVARTDVPGRRIWALLGAVPLVFPSYVAAFALVAVLSPKGALQSALVGLGVERLPGWIYGYPGALLALALYNYPYVYLLVLARLRRLDPALEESSRSLGAGRRQTLRRIVLPALAPAISAGSLLVALYTLSDFGAVSITRYDTLTLSIYTAYRALFDRTVAAALASVLIVVTGALVMAESRFQIRARAPLAKPARPAGRASLGRWRLPAALALAVFHGIVLGIPVAVVYGWGLRGLALGIELDASWAGAGRSILASGLAGVTCVALSLPVAAWAVRYRDRVGLLVERIAYAGYALPGLVVALSLVFFSVRHLRPMYQTLPLLIVAYVVRFMPQSLAASRSAWAAVPATFEEAGRSLGRSASAVLTSITLPLVRPGLLAGGALVFLTTMKELPATLILRPIGFDTLATEIWTHASEGFYAEASVPSLLLVTLSAVPVFLLVIRPALAERT